MHRALLGLAVWTALVASLAALAALARPDAGPPMPSAHAREPAQGALVPESEVAPAAPRREPHPDELSGTIAPRVEPAPAEAQMPRPPGGQGEPNGRGERGGRGEQGIPGLGPLPAGVPPEEEGVGLQLSWPDGRPAVQATVRWLQQGDLDKLRARGVAVDALDPSDLLDLSERSAKTNSSGFAIVSSEKGTMVFDARLGELYGSARIRREDTGFLRIVLARDTTLTVATVDAEGRAIGGVAVVLRSDRGATVWSARTAAADGRAVLRHADGVVAAARARGRDLLLSLDAPGAAPVTLANGVIPVEPVELTAKPGVRVRVRATDSAGKPCASGHVRLERVDLERNGLERVGLAPGPTWSERELASGEALFDGVEPGARLRALVSGACGPVELQDMLSAPSEPGAETLVELRHTAPMPRVVGRLLDPSGTPWREFACTAWVARGTGAARTWERQGSCALDQQGAFALDLPAWHAAAGPIAISLVGQNPWGRTVVSEEIELAPPAAAARDLAGVPARDWPVLARGMIVDEHGIPVEGAAVELAAPEGGVADPRTRSASDARGQFALRGPAGTPEQVRVRASDPSAPGVEVTLEVPRGERAARLVLAVHGRLSGRVLLPEDAPEAGLVVRLHQGRAQALAVNADADGRFAFSNVLPGEWRVGFTPYGFPSEVLAFESVVVPRGAQADDARLASVDLRERLAVAEFLVADERGEPVPNVTVVPAGGASEGLRPTETADGVLRVLVPRGTRQLRLEVPGYEPANVEVAAGRRRVQLVPQPR